MAAMWEALPPPKPQVNRGDKSISPMCSLAAAAATSMKMRAHAEGAAAEVLFDPLGKIHKADLDVDNLRVDWPDTFLTFCS